MACDDVAAFADYEVTPYTPFDWKLNPTERAAAQAEALRPPEPALLGTGYTPSAVSWVQAKQKRY